MRINEPERLQHMKDSFVSFKDISDDWIINIRGKLRDEATAFLKENLGDKLSIFEFLDDSMGWIVSALEMLKVAKYDYVFMWNEDHLNIAHQELYDTIVSEMTKADADYIGYSWWIFGKDRRFFDRFDSELDMQCYDNIDIIDMTPKKWKILIKSGYSYFLMSLCGIYKKDFLRKMMIRDKNKLPIFLTKFLFKAMGLINILGIRFNTKKGFRCVNRFFRYKLRRYPKETPFELEKDETRIDMLPLRIALVRQELFACIDDDLNVHGYSLISRGLYKTSVKN